MPPSSPTVSGESSDSVWKFWPTTLSSPASILRDALAVRLDQAALHVGDGLDGAALLGDDRHLGSRAPSTSSSTSPSITFEPSKMSG